MTWRPAMFRRCVRCSSRNPSYTHMTCVTPSPLSTTTPVEAPREYSVSMACGLHCSPPKPNFSNMISAIFFRLSFGFRGASVSMMRILSGSMRPRLSSLIPIFFSNVYFQSSSISSQRVITPFSMGYVIFRARIDSVHSSPTNRSWNSVDPRKTIHEV